MNESYPKFLKMVSKPTRPLDYAMLKFTSSGPALDYAITKFWRPHTHDNVAIGCAFSPSTLWYKNGDAATKNGRVMKI